MRRRLDDEEPIHIVTFRPGKEENILYGINKASVLFQRYVTDVLKKERFPRPSLARQGHRNPVKCISTFPSGDVTQVFCRDES